jgi:hypothetical protein
LGSDFRVKSKEEFVANIQAFIFAPANRSTP